MRKKLVGNRTVKAKLEEVRITESMFADDAALYATRQVMKQVGEEFVKTAAEWSLTVSLEKTKLLTMGKWLKPEDNLSVQLDDGEMVTVDNFTYPGSKGW